jgi:hypothetical protein
MNAGPLVACSCGAVAKNVGAKTSVRGEHPAAHLPGGLRRSAKKRGRLPPSRLPPSRRRWLGRRPESAPRERTRIKRSGVSPMPLIFDFFLKTSGFGMGFAPGGQVSK